jgi:hypothetical protein
VKRPMRLSAAILASSVMVEMAGNQLSRRKYGKRLPVRNDVFARCRSGECGHPIRLSSRFAAKRQDRDP